jgi:Skp family chaperone for outer membrane proteins
MNGKFDRALRHMAELSAIARVTTYSESIRELVLQVIAISDPFSLKTPSDVQTAIDLLFGIPIELKDLTPEIELLVIENHIRTDFGSYALTEENQLRRASQISASKETERCVYANWIAQLIAQDSISGIDHDKLVDCMRDYLGNAFRQHGIETAQILDPSSKIAEEQSESLVHVLNAVLAKKFSKREEQDRVRSLIISFFSDVAKYPERRRHLIDLADGAYSFYTFFIDPEVSNRIRQQLTKLEFYLDTNYLWGLLGLHDNQYVEASVELFGVAKRHHLPFSFKYHKETERELMRSVASASDALRERAWKSSISATLRKSVHISGIERKYHEKNATKPTDVQVFLKPYENITRVVQAEGIKIDNREVEWKEEVNQLFHEYEEYLAHIEKEKTYEAMQHDVRLLWLIRGMRSNAKSPLQAGVLFLTCDYRLYNFDIQNARRHRRYPAAILPNVLLQVLRPAIQQSEDFDALFIKTFSLPEFRTYSRKSSEAVHKMAEILSAVEDLPASVAEQMLMDEILVRDISRAKQPAEVIDRMNEQLSSRIQSAQKELANLQEELRKAKDMTAAQAHAGAQREAEMQARVREAQELKERVVAELAAEQARRDAADRAKLEAETLLKSTGSSLVIAHSLIWCLVSALAGAFIVWCVWYVDWITSTKRLSLLFLAVTFVGFGITFRRNHGWSIAWIGSGIAALIGFLA